MAGRDQPFFPAVGLTRWLRIDLIFFSTGADHLSLNGSPRDREIIGIS